LDLAPVLRDVQDVGEALAMGKPVEVRLEAPERLPVAGAAGPLRRLFLNLVSNAVKFTDRGAVTLAARAVDEPAPASDEPPGAAPTRWIEVSVSDTGTGIPRDALPRVF